MVRHGDRLDAAVVGALGPAAWSLFASFDRYGHGQQRGSTGQWRCANWRTGERLRRHNIAVTSS